MNDCTGAGIIIFFDNRGVKQNIVDDLDNNVLFLFLITNDNQYDFPKGTIDLDEYPLSCAIRETSEEINLFNKKDYTLLTNEDDFFSCGKGLRMYAAELFYDSLMNARININPHTEIKEHSGFKWLPAAKGESMLPAYLKSSLNWAERLVLDFLD